MDMGDIVPSADPTDWRCMAHVFQHMTFIANTLVTSAGSPFQVHCIDKFPPTILFDMHYAGVVVHHFGTPKMKDGMGGA